MKLNEYFISTRLKICQQWQKGLPSNFFEVFGTIEGCRVMGFIFEVNNKPYILKKIECSGTFLFLFY